MSGKIAEIILANTDAYNPEKVRVAEAEIIRWVESEVLPKEEIISGNQSSLKNAYNAGKNYSVSEIRWRLNGK